MKKATIFLIIVTLLTACQSTSPLAQDGKKTIVVTYSVLGSLVRDLVGADANVVVLIPNGQDPHEWEPSAKDIETLNKADLIVQNGLNLEGGLQKTLSLAVQHGVKSFSASDHITIRKVGQGEGVPNAGPDQLVGASDPHLWTDPLSMQPVIAALAEQLKTDLGLDESANAGQLETQLDSLNNEIVALVSSLPEANRKLVTDHEALGYFADRYGFTIIGAVVPGFSTDAAPSAQQMAGLIDLIKSSGAPAIFLGQVESDTLAAQIANETSVKVVSDLYLESLTDGTPAATYIDMMKHNVTRIVDALK